MTQTADAIKAGVLYEAYPRDLAPYAKNADTDWPYEHFYGQFIKLSVNPDDEDKRRAGKSFMVDTFLINCTDGSFGGDTNHRIQTIIDMSENGVSSWFINKLIFNHYYCDIVELNDNTAPYFTEFCDLHQFEQPTGKNIEHYSEDDLAFHVHLYHEHGFSWTFGDRGITLIRKNATPEPEYIVDEQFRKLKEYSNYGKLDTYYLKQLEKTIYNNRNNQEILDRLQEIWHYVNKCAAAETASNQLDAYPSCYEQMKLPIFDEEGD